VQRTHEALAARRCQQRAQDIFRARTRRPGTGSGRWRLHRRTTSGGRQCGPALRPSSSLRQAPATVLTLTESCASAHHTPSP